MLQKTYGYLKMRRVKLDKIDRKILHDLQEDGRKTNSDLSKSAGISAPPCLRRVRTLEEAGYIKGYFARLDASLLGYGVSVFAHVRLQNQAEQDLLKFEDQCKKWDKVRECHMLAGEVDFLLKIVAKNWDDYQEFLTNHLVCAPNVTSVRSSLSIRSAKDLPGVPIDVK